MADLKFPSPYSISGPDSLHPSGGIPTPVDTSGIAQGVQELARGVARFGQGVGEVAGREQDQEDAVDLSRAEASKTKAFLGIQNGFTDDPDYSTFGTRAAPQIDNAVAVAGNLIRNPKLKERWLADQDTAKVKMNDAIYDVAMTKKKSAEIASLSESLDDNSTLISDPQVPTEVREKARKDMAGSITMGVHTGLITAEQGYQLSQKLKDADNRLAVNIAELDIAVDPQRAHVGLAIPDSADTGRSILTAQARANGGKPLEMDFSLAKMTSELIGDANFPTDDPKLAKAYLSDPEVQQDYLEAAQNALTDRYKGDISAVVIAMDPNGGTELADKWVQSKHSEWVLPPAVRKRYTDTMAGLGSNVSNIRIPIDTEPGVDLNNVDPNVLSSFEKLQSAFGSSLPILSGYRDPAHNAEVGGADKSQHIERRAIDVNVSAIPNDQRVRLIEMASSMGFNGIGVYKNSMHLDTGDLRAWGPNQHSDSVPGWAKDAIAMHLSGKVKPIPSLYSDVAPEYANLTFDQRLALDAKAKSAMNDREVGMKASLQTIMDNAPAAIQNTGTYDGATPTATDFVKAYGAEEGIQKYRAFDTSLDTAKSVYSMRTMSNSDINAMVSAATPTATGNTADLEQKRFQVVAQAAQSVIKARADDPAGYVLDSTPTVNSLFQAAQKDPTQMKAALSAMATAQEKLGITDPQLLPKAISASAVATFNDSTIPAQQRIASVAGLVLSTDDPAQQDAIFKQLVGDHLPPMVAGAMGAFRRSDGASAAYLMRAAMIDPAKLPGGDDSQNKKDVDEAVAGVFSQGNVADILFGITDSPSSDNDEQVQAASELITRDARLRMVDGSAGGNAQKAVQLATKDYFGDVQVVKGSTDTRNPLQKAFASSAINIYNVQAVMPTDANVDQMKAGFGQVGPLVRSSLKTFMTQNAPAYDTATGEAAAVNMSVDNYLDTVMSDGYFTNAGSFLGDGSEGYVFYNPKTDSPVQKPDGTPLVFTQAQIIAARNGITPSQ